MGQGGRSQVQAGVTEITTSLPPGFLVRGAVRGLFKAMPDPVVLPQKTLSQAFRIEAEPTQSYARLCGFTPAQGVPMTWPHILSFPLQLRLMMDRDFPYPAMGLIHLRNTIRQHGRLFFGDDLQINCRAGGLFCHPKGQAFSLETTAKRDGAIIWSSTSLYLKRGVVGRGPDLTEADWGDDPTAGCDHKIDSLSADLRLARQYARLSGDANPIHTSWLGARILGLSGPLAHGMWTKARCISALISDTSVDVAEAEVCFRNPLLLPAQAELYANPSGTVRVFDCRDSTGARVYLRGRLSLS